MVVATTADNLPYEKVGKNEPVCIADEVPFEIPESWEWVRLKNITYEKRLWKDVKNGFTHFADNDVVIAKITPCFQNRKSAVIHDLPSGYGAGTTELHVLRDYTKKLYMPYFLMICKTHAFVQNGMKNFSGTAGQQRVGKEFIFNYLVPLPPVNEQKRIVEKINDVIESCDIL